MKLTEYGAPAPITPQLSKEDERSAALARRAQRGDYDDGKLSVGLLQTFLRIGMLTTLELSFRPYPRTTCP